MNGDFEVIVERFGQLPGVTLGKMFGSQGLKIGGKVFSMCVRDHLVVKLPAARVRALLDQGVAVPFDPGHGRVMKEWVSIPCDSGIDWAELSAEAMAFVGRSGTA